MSESNEPGAPQHEPHAGRVLVVRRGPGANCSSIGSAVEILFLSATAGAAILAAVSAVLRDAAANGEPPEEPGGPERAETSPERER